MTIEHPELYWLIIGVTLLFLEMALPGFILFFFGAGALITALACWLVGCAADNSLPLVWQLLLFITGSLLLLFFLREKLQKRWNFDGSREGGDDVDTPSLIKTGEKGVVTIAVKPPAEGQMKCGGSFWQIAAEEELAEGEIVIVRRQENLTVHVERAAKIEA